MYDYIKQHENISCAASNYLTEFVIPQQNGRTG